MNWGWPDWKLVATIGLLCLFAYGAANTGDVVKVIDALARLKQ